VTIPYRRGTRQHGTSSFSLRRMVELALTGIAAHSVRPLRFAIWLALGFALLSLLFIVYAVVSFLFVQHTVAGWSSLIAIVAILGAASCSCSYHRRICWPHFARDAQAAELHRAETEAERTAASA